MESRRFRLKKIKEQVKLFIPVLLLLLSLIFLLVDQFETPVLNQFRLALTETVTPVVRFVSAPIRWSKSLFHSSVDLITTYHNNKKLRAENEELQYWKNEAIKLEAEQLEFQKLLNYVPPKKSTFITAQTLADNGSRFSKTLIVSAGFKQGVSKGDIAMTSHGVFGRIIEVGLSMSRLMLLTDYASRIPVMVGKEKIHAIMTGDGSNRPKLIALPENTSIQVQDIVLTSGQVGLYPAGLNIGIIESIDDGDIKVRLFEENMSPDFVRLVNFGLSNVLLSSDSQKR